jgi:hypothetical protein
VKGLRLLERFRGVGNAWPIESESTRPTGAPFGALPTYSERRGSRGSARPPEPGIPPGPQIAPGSQAALQLDLGQSGERTPRFPSTPADRLYPIAKPRAPAAPRARAVAAIAAFALLLATGALLALRATLAG